MPSNPQELCRRKTCHHFDKIIKRGNPNIGVMGLTRGKRMLGYVVCLFVFIQFAAAIDEGTLHKIAEDTTDHRLKEKILAFNDEGVERSVNMENYDPENVIARSESLLGTPHKMGGYSPEGLDCSGLVKLSHAHSGVELPHSSHEQAKYGTIISRKEQLQRGDLVFFHSTYPTEKLVTHSGIYLGDNKFIHTSTSRGVSVSALFDSGYWEEHYLFATRLVHE